MTARLAVFSVMAGLGACEAPKVDATPPEPAAAAASAATPARASGPSVASPTGSLTPVGDWGVTITLPPTATLEHDAVNDQVRIELVPCAPHPRDELAHGGCKTIVLRRVSLPAPATLTEARERWDREYPAERAGHPAGVRALEEGATPAGGVFTVRSFEVRVGISRGDRIVHTYRPVTRVHAVLALGGASRVECTGYWEHGADSAGDPAIAPLRDACTSMARTR